MAFAHCLRLRCFPYSPIRYTGRPRVHAVVSGWVKWVDGFVAASRHDSIAGSLEEHACPSNQSHNNDCCMQRLFAKTENCFRRRPDAMSMLGMLQSQSITTHLFRMNGSAMQIGLTGWRCYAKLKRLTNYERIQRQLV